MCKPVQSFTEACKHNFDQVHLPESTEVPIDTNLKLSILEFVELLCRLSFILEIRPQELLSDVLVDLLSFKHSQLWSGKPTEPFSALHLKYPRTFELPIFKKLPKNVPDKHIDKKKDSRKVHLTGVRA